MRMTIMLATIGLGAIGGVSAADAQLIGGQVGGALGGTVGGVGNAGAAVDGSARVDAGLPDPSRAVDATARTAGRAADATARAADRTAEATTRAAGRTARDRNAVHVDAGASVRVRRGTRCYYDDYYYDPTYRDGHYYCERTGPATGAGVGVGVGVDARTGR